MRPRLVFCLAVVAALGSACGSPHQLVSGSLSAQRRAELEARSAIVFTTGVLYKPNPAPIETLASKLAPLIIEQLNGEGTETDADRFGSVDASQVDASRPAVYASDSQISIHGQTHAQVTFVWCYAPEHTPPGSALIQGLRITLNRTGAPVIWEPLLSEENLRVIFVARSLEAAAATEFGRPLPGRHYSIEPGLEQESPVVVAKVIDDGPVAMGPIVYLQAQTRAITTVLCRCMPAQIRQVAASQQYDLMPMESLINASSLLPRRARALLRKIERQGDLPNLRLPRLF
jgi:hypothetical protein